MRALKSIVIFLLAAALLFSFAACKDGAGGGDPTNTPAGGVTDTPTGAEVEDPNFVGPG